MAYRDWNAIEANIDRIVKETPEPFDSNTIANVRDLLNACRIHSPLPSNVIKGYWSTFTLSWPKFQIEVFEDRFEVYHFTDKGNQVWYEEHRPGEGFSSRFLSEMPKLAN